MELPSFSVIIPVAKEGIELYDRIKNIYEHLYSLIGDSRFFEIIVVSDVFDRETIKALLKLSVNGLAKCLFLTKRIGKGGSIKNAVTSCRGDYIVLFDADIPVNPGMIIFTVYYARKHGLDLVIANRVYRSHNLIRKILSIAYNRLVDLFFRTRLRDHQAGFKILSRRAAKTILLGMTRTDGLAYDTELIVWAKKYGLRYGAINVLWQEKRTGGSNIPPLRAVITMFADLIMLRLLSLSGKSSALRRIPIGKIIDLGDNRRVGEEYMTVVNVSGPKKKLFNILRKIYAHIAFKRR